METLSPYTVSRELIKQGWSYLIRYLVVTGMIEEKIKTCGICGLEAQQKRKIDVCSDHTLLAEFKTRQNPR